MGESGERILVLGGARSGKSRYAESLAEEGAASRVYIATAEARDEEMAARIEAHQRRRGADWQLREAPLNLPEALRDCDGPGGFVLVDCVTLWLTNLLLAEEDTDAAVAELLDVLSQTTGTVVLVSNEVGLGIVPDNALARRFRDVAGAANQRIAKAADRVVLVTAGLPMTIKSASGPA